MENIQQMSMLEVAVKLMNDKKTQQPISKIIKEVLEMKGIDDPNGDYASQLYLDITTSSLFVYMGDDEWNLKSRESGIRMVQHLILVTLRKMKMRMMLSL